MTSKIVQGEGQDRNVYNAVKRIVRDMSLLTNEQLAIIHYEAYHEAFKRSDKQQEE